MKLRTPLRLILLLTALVASGATTKLAHAVPSGECAAWDSGCLHDCWYDYTYCPTGWVPYPHWQSPDDCQRIYDACVNQCCISTY
jgi:hypothetical protein